MCITWYWEQTFTCNKIQNSRARFLVRKLKCLQHFQKWIDIHDHLNWLYMYLSIIIITIPHKTMNKSVLTSSWKGMRMQTLEQNREWRFIRRYICTSIVITTCLWCYITIVKKIQRIKLIKRIQLGFFILISNSSESSCNVFLTSQSKQRGCCVCYVKNTAYNKYFVG